MIDNINKLLDSLSKSKFRGSFHLNKKMRDYVMEKSIDKIARDAYDIINKRLAPAYIEHDGKQTPMRQVHPVFIGQHATGTCCRNCLMKIHHIPKGRDLTDKEVRYIVNVIMIWIQRELK